MPINVAEWLWLEIFKARYRGWTIRILYQIRSVPSEQQIIIVACLTKQLWKKDDEIGQFRIQEGRTDCPFGGNSTHPSEFGPVLQISYGTHRSQRDGVDWWHSLNISGAPQRGLVFKTSGMCPGGCLELQYRNLCRRHLQTCPIWWNL